MSRWSIYRRGFSLLLARLALRAKIDSEPCIGCVARLQSGSVAKTPARASYGDDIVEVNAFESPTPIRSTRLFSQKRSIRLLHATGIPQTPEKLSAYQPPKSLG